MAEKQRSGRNSFVNRPNLVSKDRQPVIVLLHKANCKDPEKGLEILGWREGFVVQVTEPGENGEILRFPSEKDQTREWLLSFLKE